MTMTHLTCSKLSVTSGFILLTNICTGVLALLTISNYTRTEKRSGQSTSYRSVCELLLQEAIHSLKHSSMRIDQLAQPSGKLHESEEIL